MARRLDDPRALLVALHGRHWAALAPDRSDLRLANAAQMLDVAAVVGDEEMAFLAHHARCTASWSSATSSAWTRSSRP